MYMCVHSYMWYILQMDACVYMKTVFVFTLIPSGPDSGLSRHTSLTGVGTGDPPTEWEGFVKGKDGTVQELECGRAGLLKPSKSQSLQVLRSPGSVPLQVAFECGRLT